MKRYRVLTYDFDTRATVLRMEIEDSWSEENKELWRNNQNQIRERLVADYGAYGYNKKIDDFTELGPVPFSIVAFHNKFLKQIRNAFVIGSYYPSLTSACALGERILNQLILHLRDDFKATPEYKKVYSKDSFDDWDFAIKTLESWGVLLSNVADKYRELKDIRNRSLHFNPETDVNDRELALAAIRKLSDIIKGQFSALASLPWFIPGIKGVTFVKKDLENKPFVNKIILPCCRLVGYQHNINIRNGQWIVEDDFDYEDREITDEEFRDLYNARK